MYVSARFLSRIIFLLPVFCLVDAVAAPAVHVGASSYSIKGKSALVLSAEIRKKGPVGEDGRRHPAKTKWDLQWKINYAEMEKQCSVESIGIIIGITHIRPIWRDLEAGSQSLVERWKLFQVALEKVEKFHTDLAVSAGHEIELAALSLEPQSTCEELEPLIENLVQDTKIKYQLQKTDYETQTDFGRKVGLSLM